MLPRLASHSSWDSTTWRSYWYRDPEIYSCNPKHYDCKLKLAVCNSRSSYLVYVHSWRSFHSIATDQTDILEIRRIMYANFETSLWLNNLQRNIFEYNDQEESLSKTIDIKSHQTCHVVLINERNCLVCRVTKSYFFQFVDGQRIYIVLTYIDRWINEYTLSIVCKILVFLSILDVWSDCVATTKKTNNALKLPASWKL